MKTKQILGTSTRAGYLAITLVVAGISLSANAAEQTWDGAASGIWNTSALNWAGAAFTSSNDALFTGTPTNNVTSATGLTIGTITLHSSFTGSVSMTGNNTVSGATTISGGTLSVLHTGVTTGTVTATDLGTSAITINSGGTFTVDDTGNGTTAAERILALGNNILGAGIINAKASALMTNGWSSVNLTGNLSGFTGTFNILAGSTINRGKVKFTAASQEAVLSSSATVNVANGAQLYLTQAYNYGFAIHLNGGTGGESNGSLRLDNSSLDVTGAVTLHADSIISGAGKISGAIGQTGGTYRLTKVGNNTTVLTGTNTYGGGTTISAGTVSVGNNSALGSGAVIMGGGSLNVSIASGVTLANNFTLNNPATFTASTGALTLNGNVTGSPTGNWTLTATNKITLAGTNSPTISGNFNGFNILAGAGGVDITGSTTINGNVLNQQSGYMNMVGTSTVAVKSGGSLTINGTTHASFPTSIVGQNAAGTSTLIVDGGTLTIGANNGIAFGNNITTAIGVLTVSSGTATINRGSTTAADQRSFVMLGKDTATGTINLNGGVLATDRNFVRDGSGTADGSGAANFNFGGGTLRALADQTDWLNSSTKNTNQLALTSVTTTGTSTIDANGFSVAINNAISGSGGFSINSSTGTGVVTFGGANTYTGATSVLGGKLLVTGSTATGSAVTVSAGTITATPVATLGGAGTVGGNLALSAESATGFKNGGVLAPTASASGTKLSVTGTTTFNIGSIFEWDLNAVTTDPGEGSTNTGNYGQLAGTGAIGGSGSVFQIVLGSNSFSDAFWNTNKSWTNIFTGTGATTDLASIFSGGFGGSGVNALGIVADRGGFTFNGASTLTWTAVPEPTGVLAGFLVGAGLLRRRRC